MMRLMLRAILVGGLVLSLHQPARAGGEAGEIHLRDAGYFYVGLEFSNPREYPTVSVFNHMYVGYALPAERSQPYPLILVHDGLGQSTTWLGTPDGRDGWADYFVAAGFDTYWVDRPGFGRSSPSPDYGNGLILMRNSGIARHARSLNWPGGVPTPASNAVRHWLATVPSTPYAGDEIAARDIGLLLQRIGPAILIAHGDGAPSSFLAASQYPEQVLGIIAIEADVSPLGEEVRFSLDFVPPLPANFTPDTSNGCERTRDPVYLLPQLSSFEIILMTSEFGMPRSKLHCLWGAWTDAGVGASGVYLPDEGFEGTGRFVMLELSNGDVAELIVQLVLRLLAP